MLPGNFYFIQAVKKNWCLSYVRAQFLILHIGVITLKLLVINTDKRESIKPLGSPFRRKKIMHILKDCD